MAQIKRAIIERIVRQSKLLSANRRFLNHAGRARWLANGQRVDMFHARNNIAPCGILLVEEAGIVEADEELAVRAVRAAAARHRTYAALMRLSVELSRKVWLF